MQSNSKMLTMILLFFTVFSFVSAQDELGTFKQGNYVDLIQTCSVCSYVTLDSVKLPNATILYLNTNMTKTGNTYHYNFTTTDLLGEYIYNTYSGNYTAPVSFVITGNGNESPSGAVIVLFSLSFLVIMGFLVYELIVGLGHFVSLDLDAVDLAKSLGTYFALLALYQLSVSYLGNPGIDRALLVLVSVGGFTHVIVPIVGFIVSITVGSLRKKNVDYGTGRIYRRSQL